MAISTINSTDSGASSLTKINDNFTDLDTTKADLASPTFTGTPSLPTGTTAVTQSPSDNSTKIATTAYVDATGAQFSGVKLSGGSAIATTGATVVDFSTEDFDTDGYHEGVTNPSRITFPSDGKYQIGAWVTKGSSNSAGFKITIDGTTDVMSTGIASGTYDASSASIIIEVTSGQYAQLTVNTNNVAATAQSFWAFKIK